MQTLVALLVILSLSCVNSTVKFQKIEECKSSNRTVSFRTCNITNDALNIKFEVLKPITSIEVSSIFYLKEGSKYRQLIRAPKIDWCAIVGTSKTKKNQNPVVKLAFEPVRKIYPMLFECPLKGTFEMENVVMPSQIFRMLPSGVYRIYVTARTPSDDSVAVVSLQIKAT